MKAKNYTLIFMVFLGALNLNAQNVNIPDTNFKNALLNHNPVIDTNDDGEIQVSEAEALIGALVIDDNEIDDLTGIEAFVNITELDCSNNQLTGIDLSDNTVLTTLNCYDNQLTTLDIYDNSSLTGISCQNNQLTTLDISLNLNIEILSCQNNQLINLNVANGNNSNFLYFDAIDNNLTCIQIDNGFTPPTTGWDAWNKDSSTVFSDDCEAFSVSSYQQQEIVVYPNPVQDVLKITSPVKLDKITIYTLSGQEVLSIVNVNHIDVAQLSQGIYLAKIDTKSGSFYQKIIKK